MTIVSTSLSSGKRFRLQCISILALCLLAINVQAAPKEINGIFYNLDKKTGEAEVTHEPETGFGYSTYQGVVVIPDSVVYEGRTYVVTAIGKMAFNHVTRMKSVSLPSTLKTIADRAFLECRYVKEIRLPNGVKTIGTEAFYHCAELEVMHIPDSLETIGTGAFTYCGNIDSVLINNLEHWCNLSWSGGTLPEIPHLIVDGQEAKHLTFPSTITTVAPYAFMNCKGLQSIAIPEGVTAIGYGAFNGCSNVTSVSIPSSVSFIDEYAFASCSQLPEITIPDGVTTISDWLFYSCKSLKSVKLPKYITSIGYSAFSACRGLTSFVVPEKTVTIGSHAFSYCTGLTSITLPEGLESIGGNAFHECTALPSITIPASVSSIGYRAFSDNKGYLRDVYCRGTKIPETDPDAFGSTYIEDATLHVPASALEDYMTTKPWSGFGEFEAITTGISKTRLDDISEGSIYDLRGNRLHHPQKGIRIIKSPNAPVKKVLVK